MEKYIMFSEYAGRRQYVSGTSTTNYQPRFTNDPKKAMVMSMKTSQRIDRSTPEYLQIEPWTPGLQEMIQEAETPPSEIHFAFKVPAFGSIRTVCDALVHADSVTTDMDLVTCSHCRRWKAPQNGREVEKGYWPIKGKYFNHDIRTIPASYWVWVIDKTDMINQNSYLFEFFKKNEATLRRRAKKKL